MDKTRPLLDIGSGSGVPGLMVACLSPTQEIHLVEPIAKRCAFMKTVVYKSGLTAVKVHRGRWPDVAQDIVGGLPMRAVVSPNEWPRLAVNHRCQASYRCLLNIDHRGHCPTTPQQLSLYRIWIPKEDSV